MLLVRPSGSAQRPELGGPQGQGRERSLGAGSPSPRVPDARGPGGAQPGQLGRAGAASRWSRAGLPLPGSSRDTPRYHLRGRPSGNYQHDCYVCEFCVPVLRRAGGRPARPGPPRPTLGDRSARPRSTLPFSTALEKRPRQCGYSASRVGHPVGHDARQRCGRPIPYFAGAPRATQRLAILSSL